MNKFYANLHTVIGNFRKPFLNICFSIFVSLPFSNVTDAQCTNSNAAGSVNAPAPGSIVQIGGCVMAGDYATINTVAASTSYTVTSSTSSDFFTIRQGTPGGMVIASGNSPLTWTSTVSGTYYVHLNTNAACGTQAVCRTVTISNGSCITPPAPLIVPAFANMCLGDPPVKLQVMSSAPATSQFCASNLNIPVPDNNQAGVFSNVNVAGIPISCTITGISVTINMPHTKIGDMVFVLKAPNGQVINLDYHLSTTGGSGPTSGFINTIISSAGTVALSSGTNPYTATFKADLHTAGPSGGYGPAGPTGMIPTTITWGSLLAAPMGNWTLGMYDGVASNTGTLNSWCLNITYSCAPPPVPVRPAVWSPAVGLYMDPASTVPYVAGTQTDVVWARPVPAGVYTYQATVTSYNAISIPFTNPAPITIPVGGTATPYPSDLIVAGLPMSGISVKSVTLNGITHTSSEDVDIILQSPSGQNVILMSDVGSTTNISGATYTLADSGPSMSTTVTNPSGTYKPTNNGSPDNFPAPGPGSVIQTAPALSFFTGSMNGVWKLFVVDDDGTANQGSIAGGYTITFDAALPGCTSPPTTVVVTVNQQATITTQPVNQNICIGNNATFSVVVSGTAPVNYQWMQGVSANGPWTNIVNGGIFSGVNSNTLTITTAPVSMSGTWYRVVLNGGAGCGGNISSAALLTVNPLPNVAISANPIIIAPGQETIIRSTVTPNPAATYTWYLDGVIVPGATADTIVVDINSLGAYQLSVNDVNGCSNLSNIITIAHAFTTNLFVYPNPSTGRFQVRSYSAANNILPRSLIVYNNKGDMILTRNYTQTSPYQKIEIDLRPFGRGIYWVENRDQNGKRININRVVIQ
jgi:subtilisin-like proprotein convertase family protein